MAIDPRGKQRALLIVGLLRLTFASLYDLHILSRELRSQAGHFELSVGRNGYLIIVGHLHFVAFPCCLQAFEVRSPVLELRVSVTLSRQLTSLTLKDPVDGSIQGDQGQRFIIRRPSKLSAMRLGHLKKIEHGAADVGCTALPATDSLLLQLGE